MAKYSAVKATVNAYIKQNGRKEITGRILNAVLNATIDSLGKYFQFAGGALPTDDPGTPDQNVCYLAGEPGVYTNFGGITIENEEVALLFWDGEWTKQRILIGIREVNASVDNQVGTPSVDVSYSGGELVLTFHNLKGDQGETGDPAGFGTIGADINGGVGTPGVSVETSGDNTAKNLMFHFTNLKGETGVTSVVATIDDTSGAPSCQVSLVGQQLTLAFSGLKGLKGDTGVSADYPITIYNGLDSDATDQALAAAQGKVLDGKVSQLGQEITESDTNTIPTVHLTGLKLRTGGITSESASYELNYFAATANIKYSISFRNSSGIIRFAYSSSVPANGVSVTDYKTSASSEGSRNFTPTENCYLIVADDLGFGTGDPIVITARTSGIGYDVLNLKTRVSAMETEISDTQDAVDNVSALVDPFTIASSQIADGSDVRYPAGSVVGGVATSKCSPLILADNVSKFVYSLLAYTINTAYAIAYYDEDGAFISGLKSDSSAETQVLASAFPAGTKYIRVGSSFDISFSPSAKFYSNKDILTVANELADFKDDVDNGILAPLPTYWAVCGDSIAHANHTAMTELSTDDIYRPIDDYTNKPGYPNARSGAYPNYAYHFCKRNRMQWANYGYGGTILGEYIPKYQGENNLLYPFVGTRITQFKEGIPWNYISIMFGWNDNVMGPVYQKDKWLSETYGGDIGYPYTDDLIGTPGFATQAQKDACDALGEAYFFDAFIGTINDTGKDTWYGAWNYALGYLMREYPDAKIMIMCPFIGGTDRTNSQKFRASVKAVAEKFGVACFDFNDLEWWYFTTIMNSTPFANPDRQDGRWVKQNGETTPATIEGFNRARFCADSVHPTPLGYKWLADPIGYTLLQK